MKSFATWLFHALGWKMVGEIPADLKKFVLVAAPHTSNWDYLYGRIFFFAKGIPVRMLIKKELFFFPLSFFLKALGGIPVNRGKNSNLTFDLAKIFQNHENMVILFTPEGTRKYSPNWKKGFYYTAEAANVPIVLGYIDYEKKVGGFGPVFKPSGDVESDIELIKDFYKSKKGKYPELGVK